MDRMTQNLARAQMTVRLGEGAAAPAWTRPRPRPPYEPPRSAGSPPGPPDPRQLTKEPTVNVFKNRSKQMNLLDEIWHANNCPRAWERRSSCSVGVVSSPARRLSRKAENAAQQARLALARSP